MIELNVWYYLVYGVVLFLIVGILILRDHIGSYWPFWFGDGNSGGDGKDEEKYQVGFPLYPTFFYLTSPHNPNKAILISWLKWSYGIWWNSNNLKNLFSKSN